MIGKLFNELASSKFFNNLMFSSNKTSAKDQFGTTVQKGLENFFGKIASTVKKAVEIGQETFGVAKEIYDEAKEMDPSRLQAKDVYEFPKCLENVIGDTYVSQIKPEELVEEDSEDNQMVQKVGKKIIAQSDRKDDLKFQIFVKKDEEVDAQVIPELCETTTEKEEFESKLATVLGYLVARASASQEIKQAKTAGLLSLVEKVVSFALGLFVPTKTVTVKGRKQVAPEDKAKLASKHLAEQAVGLGLPPHDKYIALVQFESDHTVYRLLGLVDGRLEHFPFRAPPIAVVDQIGVPRHELVLEVCGLPVQGN